MPALTYALVTPVRDECANLHRVAKSVHAQTIRPLEWMIVDNGSSDGSFQLAQQLARTDAFITVVSSPPTPSPEPGGPVVKAFHAGVAQLHSPVDVLVKLDADVSFESTFFERLLDAFAREERLGIASGECFEQVGGDWQLQPVTAGHARGATRAYRWDCLEKVLPLPERVGWDTVDEVKANVMGWTTGTIPGLGFHHHRPVGARDGAPWSRCVRQGQAAHYLGYRLSYVLARSAHRFLENPAAVGILFGYFDAKARRERRHPDRAVIDHLRRRQSVRRLPQRAREALGHRSGSLGV